jgi:hypothetical protein
MEILAGVRHPRIGRHMPYRRNLVKMFEQFRVTSRGVAEKCVLMGSSYCVVRRRYSPGETPVICIAGLHARVMPISSTLYRVGRHGSAFIKGLKCALNELGICDDFMAGPFHRFREPERALMRARLGELGLLSEPTAA